MYDIIGDIHGYARELKQLLQLMNYRELDGVWKHPTRKALFVGDYIDRGPQIRETLQIVRQMTLAGSAIALMGNHEYNVLAFHYKTKEGYLREHKPKNIDQHKETLDQFEGYETDWQTYLEWFYTLPLFFDSPELRAVHACWDEKHIAWLKENNHKTMSEDLLIDSHKKDSIEYRVIEDVLKGKEIAISEDHTWEDKDGHLRKHNRLKWWKDSRNTVWKECVFNCPDKIKDEVLPEDLKLIPYSADAPPVFFGHYWLSDSLPSLQAHNVACLDYSIAKGGNLIAYQFKGEKELMQKHFIGVTGL